MTSLTNTKVYTGSCHCGTVRFRFRSEEITSGRRCNCSICIRKGAVMSARYYRPEEFEEVVGAESLSVYRFGDKDVDHCFCQICGIFPFNVVASLPTDYAGPARVGDRRVNLGCVHDLDALTLSIGIIDGRSM